MVELLALLIDAQDTDVAHVVVAAGIDAARDLDLQLAELLLDRRQPLGERLRDRDRARVGETAEIQTGAGDDVRDQPDVGGGEARRLGEPFFPDGAKAATFARVAGANPTSYGGVNLVTRLEERVSATAPIVGRIEDRSSFGDYANTLGQSYAVRALTEAVDPGRAARACASSPTRPTTTSWRAIRRYSSTFSSPHARRIG